MQRLTKDLHLTWIWDWSSESALGSYDPNVTDSNNSALRAPQSALGYTSEDICNRKQLRACWCTGAEEWVTSLQISQEKKIVAEY